ncbi:MAG TPA: hypothetical protein VGA04_16360 [Streptosporangiaceae bacterium]
MGLDSVPDRFRGREVGPPARGRVEADEGLAGPRHAAHSVAGSVAVTSAGLRSGVGAYAARTRPSCRGSFACTYSSPSPMTLARDRAAAVPAARYASMSSASS